MKTVNEEAKCFYLRFHKRLQSHKNPLIKNLSSLTLPGNPRHRLKRKWCRDLLQTLTENINQYIYRTPTSYQKKKKVIINIYNHVIYN